MGLQCVCPYMCVHVCVLRKVEGVKVGGIVQKKKKMKRVFAVPNSILDMTTGDL